MPNSNPVGPPPPSSIPVGPMTMQQLTALRPIAQGIPVDLVVFSACRTALGMPTLSWGSAVWPCRRVPKALWERFWYVDDVVTSAYFVQMYRYLDQASQSGSHADDPPGLHPRHRSHGWQQVMGMARAIADGLDESSQRRRLINGVANPFFWAGIELMGTPW